MADGHFQTPFPVNEPVHDYAPGSPERTSLKRELENMMSSEVEIPLQIGGRTVHTGRVRELAPPHQHAHPLGRHHQARAEDVEAAIAAARDAHADWSRLPWEARAAVFLKAAELLSGPYRDKINAATMLGQSKNVYQAEIDAACELADFWRFNVFYMSQLYAEQPESSPGVWNCLDHRPLEGFVLAITPFNFTSIAGNLPTAPALMGNTAVWKPAETSVYSAWVIMRVLEEAGLPPGVVNFVPGPGREVGPIALASPELAGIHFTGSTGVFQNLWRGVAENLERYLGYPRIVGETGGKDFIFAHTSADVPALVTALVRGAFEYQGQKCSAASRAFIPASLWDDVLAQTCATVQQISMGSPLDFSNFCCAVIDASAYEKIMEYIAFARADAGHEIVAGGNGSDDEGYFVQPTVVVAQDPHSRLMREEIFGPVLTLYRYEDARIDDALEACDTASRYALTGAVFCRDRAQIQRLSDRLRYAAGNFYINDKPTGAIVGQQPFGGARASGTNDKAGSVLNLLRWVSPRAIKETFVPPADFRYPHMASE